MPTIDELLKARAARQAQAKAQSQSAPTAPKVEPIAQPTPRPTTPSSDSLPQYAPALQDRLKNLADEEDYMDVELSAQSLAETMSAVMAIP